MKDFKLINQKSVTFRVKNFCAPVIKNGTGRHTIYTARNSGFRASRANLRNGYAVKRLEMTVESAQGLSARIFPDINASGIKKIFCFETHQNGRAVNAIIAVTDSGVYYVPLFGSLTPHLIPNSEITGFDCFAYSYSGDRDYVFAANEDGIFVADRSMLFEQMNVNFKAKQMQVFDNRLFVLDMDMETIHFSAALDLCDFGAESGLSGSIKTDGSLGKILELLNYNGKLLIVHEYGFRVLKSSYNPSGFEISVLCYCYESVVPGSAQALGDTVYFLTREGVCRYQKKVELLDIELGGTGAENDGTNEVKSIVYDNKYFLSTGGKTVVIEKFFDSVTVYEDLNVKAFERVWNGFSDCLAVLTEENGSVVNYVYELSLNANNADIQDGGTPVNAGRTAEWESDWIALGYATAQQYIRRILIKTAGDIDLVVMNTRSSRTIKVFGAADIQTLNLNFKGDAFKIKIAAARTADISSLSVAVGF